jgi:hypothetical protein
MKFRSYDLKLFRSAREHSWFKLAWSPLILSMAPPQGKAIGAQNRGIQPRHENLCNYVTLPHIPAQGNLLTIAAPYDVQRGLFIVLQWNCPDQIDGNGLSATLLADHQVIFERREFRFISDVR